MRQSPTKITFNYHQTPLNSQYYPPRLIQSGFVLGEPVALTDVPQLPPNYHSFSPRASRPKATTDYIYSSRLHQYQAPDPAQFAPPSRPSFSRSRNQPVPRTITQEEYNRLLYQYNQLEHRYRELQQKYIQLKRQTRSPLHQPPSQGDITALIQRYKENLIDEVKLLMDRVRLQSKERQLLQVSRTTRR